MSVSVALNSEKSITSFRFSGLTGYSVGFGGVVNISANLPYGPDISNLIVIFTTTGSNVKIGNTLQISGSTANDFTDPVIYTVIAEDGSTRDYFVTVTIAPLTKDGLINMINNGENVTNVDTSSITDMSSMFSRNTTFNQDILLPASTPCQHHLT